MSDSKTNTEKWIGALVGVFQIIMDTVQQMRVGVRDVNVAIGEQLTNLGRIVGRERAGETDDEIYRRYVRAQILANRSNGTVNDYIRIARLVLGDPTVIIRVVEFGRAHLKLVPVAVVPVAVARVLVDLISLAAMGGTRVIVETSASPDADTFAFEGDTGKGFGSVYDADAGGVFASSADRLG